MIDRNRQPRRATALVAATLAHGCTIINLYPPAETDGAAATASVSGTGAAVPSSESSGVLGTGSETGAGTTGGSSFDTGIGTNSEGGSNTSTSGGTSSESGSATSTGAGSDAGGGTSSEGGSSTGVGTSSESGSATTGAGMNSESGSATSTGVGTSSEGGFATSTGMGSYAGAGTSSEGGSGTSSGSGSESGAGSGTGDPMSACSNGIVEPPELCFGPPADIAGGPTLSGFVVADFTDDGVQDVAMLSRRTSNLSTPARIHVLAGTPVTGLETASTIFIGDAVQHRGGARPGTHGADFDLDGRTDLAFIDDVHLFLGDQAHLRVWLSQGDATFVETFDFAFEPYVPVRSAAGEFTGDGSPDVLTTEAAGLLLWEGNGAGTLGMPVPVGPAGVSWIRAADFDGDALSDVLVIAAGVGLVLLAQPGGTFLEVPAPICPSDDLGHDLDGDGNIDLLCRPGGPVLTVHLGVGDGTFEMPVSTLFGDPGVHFPVGTAGDFDGDGILDALAMSFNHLSIARGVGDGTFEPLEQWSVDADLPNPWTTGGLSVDLNADGVDELLRSNSTVANSFFLRLMVSAP